MSQNNSRNGLLVELFTQTHWGTEHRNLSPVFNQLPFTILLRIFSRGYRSLSIQASPVWTLLWCSSFRSYQHEDHYCTQQTLSALQSVFEDGQQSASRIREWETESPWRKNKEVITTLASTFTFDKPWMWGHSDHGHIVKKYMWKSKIWRIEKQTARKCWEQKLLSRSTEIGVQALWQKVPDVPLKCCSKVAKDAFMVCNW